MKVIGNRAFYECKHLESITIPAGVTELEEGAFQGCSALKEVVIPSGIKVVSDYLFHCCSSLQTVSVPDGIESIGQSAFAMCQSLERVVIPASVTEIKREAFYLCSVLSEIAIKTKTARIGSDAFAGCFHLQDILYIGNANEWEKLDSDFSSGNDDIRMHYNVKDEKNHLRISTIVEPTCSSAGYSLFSCDCGYENEMCRITFSLTNHSWDSGVVTIAPTEAREGIRTYTCILCGSAKKETIPRLTPSDSANPFTDVTSGAYYYDPVLWAVNHTPQITNGTGTNTFSPEATCTRGQVVTFLWRAKGCPEPKSTTNPFSDVPKDAYYYQAVLWANENNITNGTGATTFSPESPCTRAHVVTFLWRTANKPAAGSSNPFKDVPSGQYYTDAVLWAVNHNPQITNGTGANTFSPDNPCTRGQIVTFLYRYMK